MNMGYTMYVLWGIITVFCLKKKCFTRVYLLDFFCSGIQFYLLLSPYLCFISLLYLDLYVLGDDALISQGSFMQSKYLIVLIYI